VWSTCAPGRAVHTFMVWAGRLSITGNRHRANQWPVSLCCLCQRCALGTSICLAAPYRITLQIRAVQGKKTQFDSCEGNRILL